MGMMGNPERAVVMFLLLIEGVGGWHECWLSWWGTTSCGTYVIHQNGLPRASRAGTFPCRHAREGIVDSFSEIND